MLSDTYKYIPMEGRLLSRHLFLRLLHVVRMKPIFGSEPRAVNQVRSLGSHFYFRLTFPGWTAFNPLTRHPLDPAKA